MTLTNSAYAELMAYQRETEALAQVAGRLGWDQETMMPRGGADQRSEEMSAMEGVLHARRTDPRIADWLARAGAQNAGASAPVAAARLITARTMAAYVRSTRHPSGAQV